MCSVTGASYRINDKTLSGLSAGNLRKVITVPVIVVVTAGCMNDVFDHRYVPFISSKVKFRQSPLAQSPG